MNEITRERIATKVVEAIDKTDLKHVEIALRLGIEVIGYIGMIKRPNQYKRIPAHAWEKFRDFANSGETIENYDLSRYNEFKVKKIEGNGLLIPDPLPKPKIQAEIKGNNEKYTLTIDLILTLNGKRIEVAK